MRIRLTLIARFMRPVVFVLALTLAACDDGSSPSAQAPGMPVGATATAPAGMSKYPYLAADGGPHMLLPVEAAVAWSGATSMTSVLNPRSDYGRACTATANVQMAAIPVGSTSALVFADPPMTAWGKSADGLVEVYYLESWTGMNLDALISKATAALPTASLKDSGKNLQLSQPNAFLLFAGDTPASVAYSLHRITIPAGRYSVLVGTYAAQGEAVTVYRLKPRAAQTAPATGSAR